MKIGIENFGAIKQRIDIEPRALTVFCGKNNTGKTYALYVLNAILTFRFVADFELSHKNAKKLFQEKKITFSADDLFSELAMKKAEIDLSRSLKKMLQRFFVTDSDLIENATIQLSNTACNSLNRSLNSPIENPEEQFDTEFINNEELNSTIFTTENSDHSLKFEMSGDFNSIQSAQKEINRCLMRFYMPEQRGRNLLLPAERSGINLFFRELNSRRSALLRHVTSQTLDTAELLKDIIISRYPQPIHDYIEFMNSQPEIKRETSEFADLAAWLQKEVLKVKYKVDRYGDISVAPLRSGASVGLHLGSSTVKTFFGLWSYLNHLARKGDWLMIDEPELNLHPENQRAIARLLAQLVNRGIHVVVSTHSDYMVREWSNLIMLGSADFEGRDALAKQYKLPSAQWLRPDQVAAYEFDEGGARPMRVCAESGISTDLFDASIQSLNLAAQDIYLTRQAVTDEPPAPSPIPQAATPKKPRKKA